MTTLYSLVCSRQITCGGVSLSLFTFSKSLSLPAMAGEGDGMEMGKKASSGKRQICKRGPR